jgi:DNA-binding response OmpR family regulator
MSSESGTSGERVPVVMLVGQSQEVVRECRAECSMRGWLLHVVDDHRSLLDAVASSAPSAVILALERTEESIGDVCRAVRALCRDAYTPVVVYSNETSHDGWMRVQALGFDAFVPSAVGIKHLCDEVRTLMTPPHGSHTTRARPSNDRRRGRRRSDEGAEPAVQE